MSLLRNIKQNTIMENHYLEMIEITKYALKHDTLFKEDKIKTISFITLTLRPEAVKLPSGRTAIAKKQFLKTNQSANNYIEQVTDNYYGIAELTKKGIIHYHYLIQCEDKEIPLMILTDALNNSKFFGFTTIDDIKDINHLSNLKEYLYKDYVKTMSVINHKTKHIDDTIDISAVGRVCAGGKVPALSLSALLAGTLNSDNTSSIDLSIDFSD